MGIAGWEGSALVETDVTAYQAACLNLDTLSDVWRTTILPTSATGDPQSFVASNPAIHKGKMYFLLATGPRNGSPPLPGYLYAYGLALANGAINDSVPIVTSGDPQGWFDSPGDDLIALGDALWWTEWPTRIDNPAARTAFVRRLGAV